MCKLLQLAAGFSCLGGLILGVLALNPAGRLLFSSRSNSAEKLSLGDELQHADYLQQIEDALRRRREAKWHMAEEIIAGQRSLADAIERFHVLDHEWPPGRLRTPQNLGMSEDEWDGWGVLYYVKFVLQSRHEEPGAVLGRLEKQLQELLAARQKFPAAPSR